MTIQEKQSLCLPPALQTITRCQIFIIMVVNEHLYSAYSHQSPDSASTARVQAANSRQQLHLVQTGTLPELSTNVSKVNYNITPATATDAEFKK